MKRFYVPLYGLRIFMSIDEAETRAYLEKHGGDPKWCDKAQGCCPCWEDKDDESHRIMAVFTGGVGTVVHEATHMAWEILSICGVKVDSDNNEAMAFLMDWLVMTFINAFGYKDKP